MDILFGQSYFLRFDPKLWAAMQPYPPLGTLYAASFIRERGYSVALFDAMLAESENEWAAALDRERPRFAVIYEDNFNYLSKMCLLRMRQAAFTMIEMARVRSIPTIVCGSDATDHAEAYLGAGADFVLLGEGEATLGELLDRLSDRTPTPFAEILGLAYRESGVRVRVRSQESRRQSAVGSRQSADFGELSRAVGSRWSESGVRETERQGALVTQTSKLKTQNSSSLTLNTQLSSFSILNSQFSILKTSRRPDIKNLDALPFPAWDLVDVARYRAVWQERHGYYSMNMVTTRGCPYHCNWCAKPIWGQRYNVRSPENVVAELKWLKQTYQPDHIWFADDILGLKPGWMRRFGDLVEAEDARVPFKCLSRVDLLCREGDVAGLARAGCQIVWVGAESGSQSVLNAMEKGTKVEQIHEAARRLHAAGVRVGFFLQFGYPGETRADIEKTLQMVRDCQPDDIGMSVSYPLPGTRFYERVRSELGERQNWEDSSDLAMLYNGPFGTAFYRQLHVVLHKEFRARKAWQALTTRHSTATPATRLALTVAKNWATLPAARWKLHRLEQQPHHAFGTLAPALSQDAAATPTPQNKEPE